jgi:hypothetical protein
MMRNRIVSSLAVLLAVLCLPYVARAQHPTAIQKLQLSAFGGVSPVWTGLAGDKNLSMTLGTDLALPPVYHVRPTAEIRGTYPLADGTVSSERSIMGGLRVDFLLGHKIHPYGDFFFGRGETHYGTGHSFHNRDYVLTTTYVYSPGAGFDYDLSDHFGVKVDGQFQKWSSLQPTDSGHLWSTVVTAGVVYRFDFNRHH